MDAGTFLDMPSTVIDDFDYDAASERLTIGFKSGRVYVYRGVPEEVFLAFSSAFSRGTFFNKHIRNRYDFRELTRDLRSAKKRALV